MGHHVSVMVVQANAARACLPPGSEASSEAIRAVADTGREAMSEMRHLVGLLSDETNAESPARSPQPGLEDTGDLVSRVSSGAGVKTDLEVHGSPRPIPVAIDLSAYRVVQEALTNTIRHAGSGSAATVRLTYEERRLVVEVIDDGRGSQPQDAADQV